jgi:hypothetical protein
MLRLIGALLVLGGLIGLGTAYSLHETPGYFVGGFFVLVGFYAMIKKQ